MRAISAFLNGAGSRRNVRAGATNRGLSKLTDLFVTTGIMPAVPFQVRTAPAAHPQGRVAARRSQRFPR
jgi:hypothetical protein